MAEETTTAPEGDPQITFKIKTSSDGNHTITMSENLTVLDLKTKLAGDDYEKIPVDRQRLIYSGRVMKNEDALSKYKIKAGNTIHMVKSAQSNVAQNPASSTPASGAPRAAAGVPTNMAAGTANNPLAGLTGARYAGHMGLPGMDMFGADGGMGAPPTEDDLANMLDDPNVRQTMNEALNNPDMINMMIQNTPALRNMPGAREMLQSPAVRDMLTNPNSIRQAAAMRRAMGGGAAGGFPAPGVTDTTPAGAAGTTGTPGSGPTAGNAPPFNPFAMGMGGAQGANPFAQLFGTPGVAGQTPAQTPPAPASAGQATPSAGADANTQQNPFASLFGGAGGAPGQNPMFPGMPAPTPEQMQQAMEMLRSGGFENMFGGPSPFGGMGGGPFGAGSPPAPAPADTRPPEEMYADQLRQLNDMGFFDFDRNVAALRRSGGSVQGAIEQLLG